AQRSPVASQAVARPIGQAISRRANRFRVAGFLSPPLPALAAAGSGSYTGEALHSSGTAVPVAYHLKRIELTGGRRLLCVWLSRQDDDWPEQAASISDDGCDDGEGIEDSIQRASKPVDEGEASIIRKSPQAAAAEVNESVASTDAAAAQSPDDEAEAEAEAEDELSSRYEVTLHLGRGAYGYVVVKFVRKSKLAAHQLMERPESLGGGLVPREAAILQSVSHPNIVPLLDALESRRYYELVMPRHGLGMDLFEFIDRNPSLDEPLASYMFRQMASAVAYLHSRGIAHRDLKDENVILDERFCLMLIDFGAAAFVSPDRPFSVFCGTMEYCAPEILQGHPYFGPEADVWSLGVTLYTLVFGENPFFDVDETLAGVLKPQWKPSPQLSRLLRVMLQVDPKLRAGICEVERHPWTSQPVNIDCYNFEDVLPNCQFTGNVGSDYRQNSDEAA
uniref:Protein kinase domain-containing protein n=1 Tax=Macrostomum lignano TaxID=282301 RepID=A0A1I8GY29_9PLAT